MQEKYSKNFDVKLNNLKITYKKETKELELTTEKI